LSVCLLATLRKNVRTDLHEMFTEGWQWANEQNGWILVAIRFTVWIQGLFSGFVTIGRYGTWLLTDINLLLILICHGDTGKTCLGGGMYCPTASSFLLSCSKNKKVYLQYIMHAITRRSNGVSDDPMNYATSCVRRS